MPKKRKRQWFGNTYIEKNGTMEGISTINLGRPHVVSLWTVVLREDRGIRRKNPYDQ